MVRKFLEFFFMLLSAGLLVVILVDYTGIFPFLPSEIHDNQWIVPVTISVLIISLICFGVYEYSSKSDEK